MKIIRNIFAFLAVPAVVAAFYSLIKSFLYLAGKSGNLYMPFWAGIFCYAAFQIIFYKPMRTYVFGHELSHALAGLLSGAKIKKFKVGKDSGHVVLTKDNIWITLAPYFFPIYTFAVIIVYFLLGWVMDIKALYSYFLFLTGFTIAFHIALTVYIIGIGQPDLKIYGPFFSFMVIISVNVIVFSVLTALAFPGEVEIGAFFKTIYANIIEAYRFIYNGAYEIVNAFRN